MDTEKKIAALLVKKEDMKARLRTLSPYTRDYREQELMLSRLEDVIAQLMYPDDV